jgi:hypothetical protein
MYPTTCIAPCATAGFLDVNHQFTAGRELPLWRRLFGSPPPRIGGLPQPIPTRFFRNTQFTYVKSFVRRVVQSRRDALRRDGVNAPLGWPTATPGLRAALDSAAQ